MRYPTVFINHGGGPMPLLGRQPDLVHNMKEVVSKYLPKEKPTAIVVISAHWESDPIKITSAPNPKMYYDYGGFPREAYEFQYPAPGSPTLAQRIHTLLGTAGLDSQLDGGRGYDHGVFIPLMIMYPEADIPVVCVSLHGSLEADASGRTPLMWAVEMMQRQRDASDPVPAHVLCWGHAITDEGIQWQNKQLESWRLVQFLLENRILRRQKLLPREYRQIVQAMGLGAPPQVIALFLDLGKMALKKEAVAGPALSLCISRQYPLDLLDTIVETLRRDVRRKFIWGEVIFLQRWWQDQKNVTQRQLWKSHKSEILVPNGPFDISI